MTAVRLRANPDSPSLKAYRFHGPVVVERVTYPDGAWCIVRATARAWYSPAGFDRFFTVATTNAPASPAVAEGQAVGGGVA